MQGSDDVLGGGVTSSELAVSESLNGSTFMFSLMMLSLSLGESIRF